MTPVQRSIDIWQNGDRTITWYFTTKVAGALTYLDLTGVALKLQLRTSPDPNLPAVASFDGLTPPAGRGGLSLVTADPANIGLPSAPNGVEWDFTAAKGFPTTGIAPGHYVGELLMDPFPTTDGPEPAVLLNVLVHATGTR